MTFFSDYSFLLEVTVLLLKSKTYLTNAVKLIVKILQFKPELWNSRVRFNAAKQTDRVLLEFVYHIRIQ